MKKSLEKLLLAATSVFAMTLSSCGGTSAPKEYTIRFLDEDNATVLQSSVVKEGEMPEYTGAQPTKESTAEYEYTFAGWNPAIVEAKENADYVATFNSTKKKYTVTFYDEDGQTVLDSQQVEYGATPTYAGANPTKASTAENDYSFSGWDKQLSPVTGEASYTASYSSEVRKYTVTFYDEDGSTVLDTQQVAYGTVPTYAGANPTKQATVDKVFTFSGWDKELVAVTGEASYTATYSYEARKYTVTFYDEDGQTVLDSQQVAYGTVPTYAGETPTKESSADKVFTFAGWDKELVAVTGEASYTATYSSVARKYTIKFVDSDGTVLDSQQVEYGVVPTAPADPTSGRFAGWDKEISAVSGDETYTAVYVEYGETVIDRFEQYNDDVTLKSQGWVVRKYTTATNWTSETEAAMSIGTRAQEGKQSIRLDAWGNATDFEIMKTFTPTTKAANALTFSLMAPSYLSVIVKLGMKTVRAVDPEDGVEKDYNPTFSFKFNANTRSNEYVDYVIPMNDEHWAAWGTSGQTIALLAPWLDIHIDDVVKYVQSIEFIFKGTTPGENANQPFVAFADDIAFVNLDNPAYVENEEIKTFSSYTGYLANGQTLKIDVANDGTALAKVLDSEGQEQVPGTVAVNGKNITFTSADGGNTLVYNAKLTDGGQKAVYDSASGALANAVKNMELHAVQVVDNYEQYEGVGQAYCQKYPKKSERSGARGAYYQEYYAGSGSSPWGGDKWTLMGGNGDQLELNRGGGAAHSGNKYVSLKHSRTVAMRYMQWGLFDGTAEQQSFRGSKFSFWAKTEGFVKAIKVYFFSQSAPTNASKESDVKISTINPGVALDEWTHYEIDLNPELVYYGFMVDLDNDYSLPSSTGATYLYIDDVEVYTANPYATYAPADKELVTGNVYLGKVNGLINATLKIKSDTEVTLTAAGLGMTLEGTYEIDQDELTMSIGGATYKATISDTLNELTFVSVSGGNQVAGALNNLSFARVRGDNIESYTETGRTIKKGDEDETKNKGSSGAFYIDMYKDNTSVSSPVGGSKWDLTGSGAGAALNKEDAAEGSQSLKLLNSQYGNMRYIQWDLYKGTAQPITGVSSFSIYLKNFSADTAQTVKIMAYKVQKVDNAHQGADYRSQLDVTLPAGQDWTKYTVQLDTSKTYYGFALLVNSKWNGKDYYVGADNAVFSSVDNDPALNFYGKKGLTLNGTTNAGAASIKFGNAGAVSLTCANAGLNDVAGKYTMAMSEAGQVMTITVGENTLKGIYAVNAATGAVTFTITEATGDFAALVAVDTVFSNQ